MPCLRDILNMPDRAEAFYLLVDYYKATSDNERENIRQSWDYGKEWVYPNPETLAVNLSGKHSCEQRIIASLVCYSINAYIPQDSREILIAFCVIYHSAREIGLDIDILFKEVAKISSSKMALLMLKFIERPERDKSLKAFYCIERIIEKDRTVRFKLNLRGNK